MFGEEKGETHHFLIGSAAQALCSVMNTCDCISFSPQPLGVGGIGLRAYKGQSLEAWAQNCNPSAARMMNKVCFLSVCGGQSKSPLIKGPHN